jgi:hypothetical protein
MPDLSKTAPEQRGMPELLAAPAPCGPRPADRNLHTIRSEVKMPCLRAGRANNHAQSGSELYAILPISKRTFSYRTRPGSRHGPGQGIAGRRELLGRRDPAVVAHAHLGVGERRPVRQTFGHPCRSTPQWGQEAGGTSRGASLPVTTTSRKSLDTVGEVARLSGSRAARRRQAHAERRGMQAFSGVPPTSPTVSTCFS